MTQNGETEMKLILLIFSLQFLSTIAFATEPEFKNESELGVVLTDGNTRTKNYNVKQENKYIWDQNLSKINGQFLKSISNGIESGRYWSLGLRYERELTKEWALFLGQNIESDIFAGFRQRFNTDLGMKYLIVSTDETKWHAEAGYRYTMTKTNDDKKTKDHYARLYSEVTQALNKSVTTKLWAEYLPNFTVNNAWKANGELSISAMMSAILSLKTGYLVKFDHQPVKSTLVKTDSVFTTALVAKF